MKSSHKIVRFDYSKYESDPSWDSPSLNDYQFWGIHPKSGRIRIDTKRYKKMLNWLGATELIPQGLSKPRNTVYLTLSKKNRHDYKVNLFKDLINGLRKDWTQEYKPLLAKIKSPKEVQEESRLGQLMYTSCSDDFDDIDFNAFMSGMRRETKYNQVIQSLYCQFIQKICVEIDRFTLIVMTDLGYKGTDFDFQSFCKFSDGLLKGNSDIKIENLSKYNAYNMLHKINNFLKHNSKESYKTLKRFYPNNVASPENGTAKSEYQNGMFAGNWIILKQNYIDHLFDKLIMFFEDYCKIFLNEDVINADWDYDEYFIAVFNQVKNPHEYFGLNF